MILNGACPDGSCDCYIGEPCDDGDPYTANDAKDENCECHGTVGHDTDGDGIHDNIDICPNGPDDIDITPANGIPDACECPTPEVAK